MRYIRAEKIGWDHAPYWQYLASVKELMPAHLFAFAACDDNHDLTNPNSLHDSWIKYWNISEIRQNQGRSRRAGQIDACFLGPKHDRFIYLTYKDVEKHEIVFREPFCPISHSGHGDLLIHELLLLKNDLFSHELLFSGGAVFSVEFRDMTHRIENIVELADRP